MTVFDYLYGEAIIILLVSLPCIAIYVFASLLMSVSSDEHCGSNDKNALPNHRRFSWKAFMNIYTITLVDGARIKINAKTAGDAVRSAQETHGKGNRK